MTRALLLGAAVLACWPAFAAGVSGADVAEIRAVIQRQARCLPPHPGTFAFRGVLIMGEEVVQSVQITDRAGGAWIAYHAMQRQQDGSWQTRGCRLVQPRTFPV
jgi:hypothetical protein